MLETQNLEKVSLRMD